jgi:hypothetical protein
MSYAAPGSMRFKLRESRREWVMCSVGSGV